MNGTSSLCKRLDPHCRCENRSGVTLCPEWLDADHCKDPSYMDHAKPGTPGAPCSGLATSTSAAEPGTLDCQLCINDPDFHYVGHDHDACSGYSGAAGGAHVPGVMIDCR